MGNPSVQTPAQVSKPTQVDTTPTQAVKPTQEAVKPTQAPAPAPDQFAAKPVEPGKAATTVPCAPAQTAPTQAPVSKPTQADQTAVKGK